MNPNSLRVKKHIQLDSDRRLLIGGNCWSKKFRKIGISKSDQKKQITNPKNYECGCLRQCTCCAIQRSFKNEQEKLNLQRNVIIRDLYAVIHEKDQYEELFDDIFIRKDGVLRLNIALSQVSFGWQQGQTERIESKKIDGFINIIKRTQERQTKRSFQQSIEIIKTFYDNFDKDISIYLNKFFSDTSNSKLQITKELTREDEFLKDMEFQIFSQNCFEHLENIPEQNMFAYNIGRVHPRTKETEILHTGYSQSFLNLLGIDSTSLSSLLLRRKTIDLVNDITDITRISAHVLNWMSQNHDTDKTKQEIQSSYQEMNLQCAPISFRIITFDGFPLTLHQQCRIIPISPKQNGKGGDMSCEYCLQLFELDINLNELEALISYRKRLQAMQGQLSVEDFLKQELSLMFEDVEYSVLSQNFMEKYYSDKMTSLCLLKRQKSESLSSDKNEQRCGFKMIMK